MIFNKKYESNDDRSQELRDLIGEGFMKMIPSSSVIGQIAEERKKKQEEENERKLAMAEANNYVMQRSEVELPEEVQNMQSITQGNIPEIEPMMNNSRTPAGGMVVDEISEKMAAPQPSNMDYPITDNKPPVPEDNYSRILAELRAMREGSDEGVNAARRADSTNELMSNLNKSFSTIGDALANRAGITKIKSDPLAVKSNLAEQAEADRRRKLESLMSEYKMLTGKDQAEATRQYRQAMLEMQKLKEERADKYLKEKQRTEDRIANNAEANMIRGVLKDDPTYKKIAEQSREFSEIGSMVESAKTGNQAALAALGTKLARAMGEVGVLTDTDVVRYLGSASWARKLQDWYNRGAKGELSPQSIKDIQANIGNIQKALEKSEKEVYDRAASRIQTIYPEMKKDRIYGILGYKPSISSSNTKSKQDKQALEWARNNPNDPRAIKILQKLGM